MIGALMRRPWDDVASRMLRALHEHGFTDIDAPHLALLLWPGPDGLRPSELAARARMTKQATNYLLGGLERGGYLERRPDPDDRRARRIALTDRGQALIPVIRGVVAETEREWADRARQRPLRAAARAAGRAQRGGRGDRRTRGAGLRLADRGRGGVRDEAGGVDDADEGGEQERCENAGMAHGCGGFRVGAPRPGGWGRRRSRGRSSSTRSSPLRSAEGAAGGCSRSCRVAVTGVVSVAERPVPAAERTDEGSVGLSHSPTPTPPPPSPPPAAASRPPRRASARCPRPSRRSRTAATGTAGRGRRSATPPRCGASARPSPPAAGRLVVTRPSTTCLPGGTKRNGAKPPERASSNSRKKPSTSSSPNSASATKS